MAGRMPIQNPYNHTVMPYNILVIFFRYHGHKYCCYFGIRILQCNEIGKKLAKRWKNQRHDTVRNINRDEFIEESTAEQV